MTTPSTSPAPLAPPLRPGVGVTIYGDLPRDITAAIVGACDFVALHTAADATDVTSAAKVRRMGCDRVWLCLPANYFVRLDASKGRDAAVAEARRCARIARDMRAEVLEFNGEGESSGRTPGDWIPADAAEARVLADLVAAILDAAAEELRGTDTLLCWTSHDMPSFRLPWGPIMARVALHSPQHYPAQKGRIIGQVELAARVARSAEKWDALADRGEVPHRVVPVDGDAWVPYYQGHGHDPKALCALLSESPVARLWAYPGSWDDAGLQGLAMARALRGQVGHGPGAVQRFQQARGLTVDGIVGRVTAGALAPFIR